MRKIVSLAAVLGVLLGLVGGASAAVAAPELKPESVNLGSVMVGSGPSQNQSFLLYAGCAVTPTPLCATPEEVTTNPSTTGDFVLVQNHCPEVLKGKSSGEQKETCLLIVGFSPTAVGLRTGTLTAGGLTSTLTGTGFLLPVGKLPIAPTKPPVVVPPKTTKPPKSKQDKKDHKTTKPAPPKSKQNKNKKCGKKKGKKAKGSAVASKKGKKGCGKKK